MWIVWNRGSERLTSWGSIYFMKSFHIHPNLRSREFYYVHSSLFSCVFVFINFHPRFLTSFFEHVRKPMSSLSRSQSGSGSLSPRFRATPVLSFFFLCPLSFLQWILIFSEITYSLIFRTPDPFRPFLPAFQLWSRLFTPEDLAMLWILSTAPYSDFLFLSLPLPLHVH